MRREFDRFNVRNIHSVKNRAGCDRVMGSWDSLHDACILHEFADRGFAHGWTAPVRGAYFYWYVGPLFDYKNKESFGGAVGAVRIEQDLEYPEHPIIPIKSEGEGGIFYKKIPFIGKKGDVDSQKFYVYVKMQALEAAHDALAGRASEHDMVYYDKTGEIRCTAKSMEDDIGYPPCHGCLPCPPSMNKPKPFKIGR